MKLDRVVLGSTNRHKLAEIARMLAGLELRFESLAGFPAAPAVEEDGDSFAANAGKKAAGLSAALGLPVLADDSGICVDALGGAPGVRSARYAGAGATDAENNERLLRALEGLPAGRRGARFVCALALALDGEVLLRAQGEVAGRILSAPRGRGGFGYDPLFWSPGHGRSFGELTPAEKDRTSHRARALAALRPQLERLGAHGGGL